MFRTLMPDEWYAFLAMDRFGNLERCVTAKYDEQQQQQHSKVIFPAKHHMFRAFDLCDLSRVKCIVLGQDPYHTPGQANGLAFSCETDGVLQPSLKNIFKEVERDMHQDISERGLRRGDLEYWANQGVLLLNSVLTVEAGKPRSHIGIGWEEFTAEVITRLLTTRKHLVFMRWGNDARAFKLPFGAHRNHLNLDASHPSPLSYRHSFCECEHFKQCNSYLERHGQPSIDWTGQRQ